MDKSRYFPWSWNGPVAAVTMGLFITLIVFLGLYQDRAPKAAAESAPPTEFSAGRAMKHLEVIAQRPHPIGSTEEEAVRDYIIKELAVMGLNPEVQTATVVNQQGSTSIAAATVNNIVARLRGTGGSKAVLLVGHYDSVPSGPGASDDGSAVAAILETLRALKASAQLKNDVICLFTDGEEVGLLGARGFVDENPAAKDAGLVLNFEARGNSGPSIMFETSPGNGRLISEAAKAMPHPITNSLSYEIYRLLPNDTDLTVFKKAGYAGLNFAFIEGIKHYHSQLDRLDQIDQRSLQHHGAYALALTRHFGNLDLEDLKDSNAVYFSILGSLLVHYSQKLIVPLAVLVLLLFIGIIVIGLRRKRLSVGGIALGFLLIFLSLIGAFLVVTFGWGLALRKWHNGFNGTPFFISFVAFTVALTTTLFVLFRKRASEQSLVVGAMLWWIILMLVVSVFLPGGSYLFTWPLLFTLVGVAFSIAAQRQDKISPRLFVVIALCAVPGLLLLAPMIYLINVGLGLGMGGILMVLVVLLLASLILQLNLMTARRKWVLPIAAMAVCLTCILIGRLSNGFDREHNKTDSIFYILNADSEKAVWASGDERPDEWTSQFLSYTTEEVNLGEYIPMNNRKIVKTNAPGAPLAAPNLLLVSDRTNNDIRTLQMRITSPRRAPAMSVFVDGNTLDGSVNGKRIANSDPNVHLKFGNQWVLNYWAVPANGVDLTLSLKAGQPVKISVVDRTYSLPEIPGKVIKARPDYLMPEPYGYSDSTLVTRSFAF
jgi:hypothetical protein